MTNTYRPRGSAGHGNTHGGVVMRWGGGNAVQPATGTGGWSLPGTGGGATATTPAVVPPEIKTLKAEGNADPRLSGYADEYAAELAKMREGRSREAEVFGEGLDSNIERQIASAREQAAREGRPFNEEAARAELSRGKNKAQAEFALGTQRDSMGAMQGGLGIMSSPWQSELESKKLGLGAEGMLMDYSLGRARLANEATAAESMRAMDMYRLMLQSLASMAL